MITATFDVYGKDADAILSRAFRQADEFVGDREYTLNMISVTPRVGVYGEDRPLDYVGEVEIVVHLVDNDFKVQSDVA